MTIKVFDFFAGCGGTSAGLRDAGMEVVFGLDFNEDAGQTFQANFPDATFVLSDIRKFRPAQLAAMVEYHRQDGSLILFSGCAPCQPFSKQNGRRSTQDQRHDLLDEFSKLSCKLRPDFVFCENVPGIQLFSTDEGPFYRFTVGLRRWKYHQNSWIVNSRDYGVPQRRRWLVLIASRLTDRPLLGPPLPTQDGPKTTKPYSVVRDWISDLPPLQAGESDPHDHAHRASCLSALNLKRIRSTPPGGTRRSWPEELVLACHRGDHGGHTDVLRSSALDRPASAMTTRCISLSNGRFGHPDRHRAITPREAACLQTFPRDFTFVGNQASIACQIGNAVPVLLAKTFGQHFNSLCRIS